MKMRPKCSAAALGLGGWVALVAASPAVVADSACPHYAVDIEAFATCEGDRVAMPDEGGTAHRQGSVESGPTDHAQSTDLNASDESAVPPSS
jgi:hypothetical protein